MKMMPCKIIFFCVFFLLCGFADGATSGCGKLDDISTIIEVPRVGRKAVIREAKKFFSNLLYWVNTFKCKRISITIADHEVITVKKFHCKLECGLKALRFFEDLENQEAKPTDLSPKENVIIALNELGKKYVEGGSTQHIVLVILTSPQQQGASVSDRVKTYVENGYKFIAVGVGEGQKEKLDHITYNEDRVVKMDNIRELSGDKRERIKTLLHDPDVLSHSAPANKPDDDEVAVDLDFYEYVSDDEICKYVVDIVFLIDSSMSIKFNYREELYFVSRIAGRFDISDIGSHAAAVVFSDHIPYTKVTVRLDESKSTRHFQTIISQTPFIGYRTRIDLAFDLVTTDILRPGSGMRPNINKAIVLLTDGKQNPTQIGSVKLDPVRASREIFESGTKIFAVGIGTDVNGTQLEEITRDPNRVFFAQTFEKLASLEFVRNVSKRICVQTGELGSSILDGKHVNLVDPEVREKIKKKIIEKTKEKKIEKPKPKPTRTPDCKPKKKIPSSDCCPTNEVYINIFQPNSGPTYILQGMKLKKSSEGGNKLSGIKVPVKQQPDVRIDGNVNKLPISELINIIKKALPEQVELARSIEELLQKYGEGSGNEIGIPGIEQIAFSKRKKRMSRGRRSINNVGEENVFDSLEIIAKLSGCKLFLQALKKYAIMKNVTSQDDNRNVTIFCPIDDAYVKFYSAKYTGYEELDVLLNHVAYKEEGVGHHPVYKSLLEGRAVEVKEFVQGGSKKSIWKANDAVIKASFSDGKNSIVIIDDIILPTISRDLLEVLDDQSDCTLFYELLQASDVTSIFTATDDVSKVCFTEDICVPVTQNMKKHLSENIKLGQFSIVVPVDSSMSMSTLRSGRAELEGMFEDDAARDEFLRRHIFVGLLDDSSHGNSNTENVNIGYSLSAEHSVIVAKHDGKKLVLKSATSQFFKVLKTISVTEGMLYIVENMA